jgi:uroporphyrinogen-III synthase
LRSQGWSVDDVVAYRTKILLESSGAQAIRERNFDVVTFTSGSTVRGFAAMVGAPAAGLCPEDSGACKVVCIGPTTAEVAASLGFRIDAIANEPSSQGLVEAVLAIR